MRTYRLTVRVRTERADTELIVEHDTELALAWTLRDLRRALAYLSGDGSPAPAESVTVNNVVVHYTVLGP